jgi:hypothetical protein
MKDRYRFAQRPYFVVALALVCGLFVASCRSSVTQTAPTAVDDTASFLRLQRAIFNQSCTQCHNTDRAMLNGDLSLDSTVAYANLVNALPTNLQAASNGFYRIRPTHPDSSLLYLKIAPGLASGLGDPMPNQGHPLSPGKREFIRQWIAAGAPKFGNVADPKLLLDTSEDPQAALIPLTPPSPGIGFQIHMPSFDIQPGTEREIFLYKTNPNKDTQYVKTIDIRMREGSHHFILWNVDGASEGLTDGTLRDRTDGEMSRPRDFVNGSQTLELHYDFPPGIAVAIPPNLGFDLNSHYVNPTDHVLHGESYMNLLTTPRSQVQHIATPFLIADQNFYIPARSTYTRNYEWPGVSVPTHLIMLTSHAHKHLTSFKVWKNSTKKELLYSNSDWHEPIVANFDILLQPGEQLYSETTWQNNTSTPLQFGFTSEDEMNILLGYTWQ